MKKTIWTPEKEQELIELRYEGKSWPEIAKNMGDTPDNLRKRHSRLMAEWNTPKFFEKVRYLESVGVLSKPDEKATKELQNSLPKKKSKRTRK